MKSTSVLPQGYGEVLYIDMQKDTKLALFVNLLGLVICLALLAVGALLVPVMALVEDDNIFGLLLRMGALLLSMVLYIIGHEWVHGIFMRRCCDAEVNFGFTGLYAYAGSRGYYCKRDYVRIALAPLVLWGLLFTLGLVPLYFVSKAWFWVVYALQVTNISGAAGDIYVFFRFRKLPKEILVQDTGVAMTVFAPGQPQ